MPEVRQPATAPKLSVFAGFSTRDFGEIHSRNQRLRHLWRSARSGRCSIELAGNSGEVAERTIAGITGNDGFFKRRGQLFAKLMKCRDVRLERYALSAFHRPWRAMTVESRCQDKIVAVVTLVSAVVLSNSYASAFGSWFNWASSWWKNAGSF